MTSPRTAPAPLLTAASLAAVEGLLLVGLGVLELASLDQARVTMGVTTAVFFAAYGVGLLACAWALSRARAWGRGPVLLAQLVQLGLAWNLRDGTTTLVAVVIALVAVVVVVGLVHPRSLEALDPDAHPRDDGRDGA